MSQQTPYDQINFINDVIVDRQEKNQPTFFSVKVERFGASTPLATKENGANFYKTIVQYLTKYDLSALIIELYNGKSHNVKEPFQTFKVIVKRNSEIAGIGNSGIEELKVSPTETVITTEKHFFSMAEKERQVMMLEFDLKRLQYENEELRRKNKKKKNYIEELQKELEKTEKEKKNSLGNVSLSLIGANLAEKFVSGTMGIGILKGLGMKPEVLEGLLGTTEAQTNSTPETKSTATIIPNKKEEPKNPALSPEQAQAQKVRTDIKIRIIQFLDSNNDLTLRLYYELTQLLGADTGTLNSILQGAKVLKAKELEKIKENNKEDNIKSASSNIQGGDNPEKSETEIKDSS